MLDSIFTIKTKKKNDERYSPEHKEGVLFGGSYEDSGFIPSLSERVSTKKVNGNRLNNNSTLESKWKEVIGKMAL